MGVSKKSKEALARGSVNPASRNLIFQILSHVGVTAVAGEEFGEDRPSVPVFKGLEERAAQYRLP